MSALHSFSNVSCINSITQYIYRKIYLRERYTKIIDEVRPAASCKERLRTQGRRNLNFKKKLFQLKLQDDK